MSKRFGEFLDRLNEYADLDCLVCDGSSYTYARLLLEYERWRGRLDDFGVATGAVVGLKADYSPASVAALLALFERRAVVALLPRGDDSSSYLDDARATGVLQIENDGAADWRELGSGSTHPLLDQLRAEDDGGVVIFTSGSTGRPKAALQSVERFLHKFERPGRRFRTLAFLLFDHIAGLDTLFYTLSSGGALVITRSRSPRAVADLIRDARVEVLPASPSFLRLMCLSGDDAVADLGTLRVITYGSEPMDPSTLRWLNERFPDLQIKQKYGTTETGSPRSVSRGNDSLWLKISRQGAETRIVDNVLYIRSEGTILGYLNAPSPVDREGWYCTGDLVDVEVDAQGEWIRFRGRASDMINVGGEKVAPAEVEQVIMELEIVKEAVVGGEPHAMMGQIVAARVALATAMEPRQAIKTIRVHCRSRLPAFKVPVKIEVVEGGLTNERQKTRRRLAESAPT